MAAQSGIPISQCPTCLSRETELEPGVFERQYGIYRLNGEEYPCDCDTQMMLRKHYLLANIGEQYQRLNWNDFRNEEVREEVNLYIDNWTTFKLQGMGLEFSSPKLGTGKTFAATQVAKELIKAGERVWFYPFIELIALYQRPIEVREETEARLRNSTVLVLDEVLPPYSDAQGQLFSTKLEELVRFRTNFNRVTIMTTNLTPEMLLHHYPRSYSLLAAKQVRIELEGEDARQGVVKSNNLRMMANWEVRPIT